MILLRTYRCPGFFTQYAPEGTYDLVRHVRSNLGIPAMPWRGMNAAWPLFQGFYNRSANTPSVCCNPACNRMTYPPSKIPEGEQKYNRLCGDAGNPLGLYLCSICGRYLTWHPELPDEDTIRKLENRQTLRRLSGDDATCGMCERQESQFNRTKRTSRNGNVHVDASRFRVHKDLAHTFLCHACWMFFDNNGRVRTNDENQKFLTFVTLENTRKAGGEIHCDHCQVLETAESKHPHHFEPKTNRVLCMPCYGYAGRYGRDRDLNLQRMHDARAVIQKDRAAGRQVVCGNCQAIEGSLGSSGRHGIHGDSLMVLCRACDGHIRKTGNHRDPEKQRSKERKAHEKHGK